VTDTTPRFEAWNKLDLLDDEGRAAVLADAARREGVMTISALTGEGVDTLVTTVAAQLTEAHRRYTIDLPVGDGASLAWLHAHGEVLARHDEEDTTIVEVRLSEEDHARFERRLAS
jgi:GTP-binding protein HflX